MIQSLFAGAALGARYLRYWFRAGTAHGLHAPFVFDLYTLVIRHDGAFAPFAPIEARRAALRADHRPLAVRDYGAGSRVATTAPVRPRTVGQIARTAAKPAKYAQLLFRLANHFQARRILELGTSFGLTTAYLAAADSRARVVTLEGDPASAAIARETFAGLKLTNIALREGEFSQTLDHVLTRLDGPLDLVFFDGNHRYEPTLDYVRRCLPHRHAETVFVLDDIHWSPEMARAWEVVKALPEVTLTVDLFAVGLVFFRPNASKQHFTLWL